MPELTVTDVGPMVCAVLALPGCDPARALDLLHDCDACPIDRRDAAWRFYERAASARQRLVLLGHAEPVGAVAFGPEDLA